MKHLYLLRHAKSSWDDESLADHQRGLSPRGVRHALQMADYIAKRFAVPDQTYCSDAVRTQETLRPLAKAWELPGKQTRITPDLYLAQEKKLLAFLQAIPYKLQRVLLIGHNPGLLDLINRLTGKGEYLKKLPSGTFVTLALNADHWAAVSEGCASQEISVKPKDLFD